MVGMLLGRKVNLQWKASCWADFGTVSGQSKLFEVIGFANIVCSEVLERTECYCT